mgnify:CR=1 FL=1
MSRLPPSTQPRGTLAALWGVSGFFLLLFFAIDRLAGIALDALQYPLNGRQWALLAVTVAFMAYSEGYRGFQKSYSPRFAARAWYLYRTPPGLISCLFAPLFCMGFFRAPLRRRVSAALLTLMIVSFILLFQQIPQPWRGILDAGVVIGLIWGAAATAASLWRTFLGDGPHPDPEVPA